MAVDKNQFVEVRVDYTDEHGVQHIDAWDSEDDDAQGVCVGYLIFGEVYWTNPDYQFDEKVEEVVKSYRTEFKERWSEDTK